MILQTFELIQEKSMTLIKQLEKPALKNKKYITIDTEVMIPTPRETD
jgi:hypothetical protein